MLKAERCTAATCRDCRDSSGCSEFPCLARELELQAQRLEAKTPRQGGQAEEDDFFCFNADYSLPDSSIMQSSNLRFFDAGEIFTGDLTNYLDDVDLSEIDESFTNKPSPASFSRRLPFAKAKQNTEPLDKLDVPLEAIVWHGCLKSSWCNGRDCHSGICSTRASKLGPVAFDISGVQSPDGDRHSSDSSEPTAVNFGSSETSGTGSARHGGTYCGYQGEEAQEDHSSALLYQQGSSTCVEARSSAPNVTFAPVLSRPCSQNYLSQEASTVHCSFGLGTSVTTPRSASTAVPSAAQQRTAGGRFAEALRPSQRSLSADDMRQVHDAGLPPSWIQFRHQIPSEEQQKGFQCGIRVHSAPALDILDLAAEPFSGLSLPQSQPLNLGSHNMSTAAHDCTVDMQLRSPTWAESIQQQDSFALARSNWPDKGALSAIAPGGNTFVLDSTSNWQSSKVAVQVPVPGACNFTQDTGSNWSGSDMITLPVPQDGSDCAGSMFAAVPLGTTLRASSHSVANFATLQQGFEVPPCKTACLSKGSILVAAGGTAVETLKGSSSAGTLKQSQNVKVVQCSNTTPKPVVITVVHKIHIPPPHSSPPSAAAVKAASRATASKAAVLAATNKMADQELDFPKSGTAKRSTQTSVGQRGKKRPAPTGSQKGLAPNPTGHACTQCGTQTTPVWRAGPHGPKTLCNACGVRYMKVAKRK